MSKITLFPSWSGLLYFQRQKIILCANRSAVFIAEEEKRWKGTFIESGNFHGQTREKTKGDCLLSKEIEFFGWKDVEYIYLDVEERFIFIKDAKVQKKIIRIIDGLEIHRRMKY